MASRTPFYCSSLPTSSRRARSAADFGLSFSNSFFDHDPDPENGLSGEKKPHLLQSEIGDTHILAVVFDEVLGTTLLQLPQLGVVGLNIPAAVDAPDWPFVACCWLKTVRRLGGQISLMLLLVHRCFSL